MEQFIIGYDICPFARHIPAAQLKYHIDLSNELLHILENIQKECIALQQNQDVETSLLVYPEVNMDFLDFLDIFYACEQLLEDSGLDEEFQLVVFHPAFCYEGAEKNDPSNFTNRSPYPMIHILRVDSVSKAVDQHPNIAIISENNIKKLRGKPANFWENLRQ